MKPKSKSKMIKALRKWSPWYRYASFYGHNNSELKFKSKSEITKLFNEAIAKRN